MINIQGISYNIVCILINEILVWTMHKKIIYNWKTFYLLEKSLSKYKMEIFRSFTYSVKRALLRAALRNQGKILAEKGETYKQI